MLFDFVYNYTFVCLPLLKMVKTRINEVILLTFSILYHINIINCFRIIPLIFPVLLDIKAVNIQ